MDGVLLKIQLFNSTWSTVVKLTHSLITISAKLSNCWLKSLPYWLNKWYYVKVVLSCSQLVSAAPKWPEISFRVSDLVNVATSVVTNSIWCILKNKILKCLRWHQQWRLGAAPPLNDNPWHTCTVLIGAQLNPVLEKLNNKLNNNEKYY